MEEHWEIVGIHSKLPFLTTYIPQRIVWGGHNIIELIPGIGSCFGEGELKSGTAAISPTLTGTYFMGFVSPPTQRGRERKGLRLCERCHHRTGRQHLPFTIYHYTICHDKLTIYHQNSHKFALEACFYSNLYGTIRRFVSRNQVSQRRAFSRGGIPREKSLQLQVHS